MSQSAWIRVMVNNPPEGNTLFGPRAIALLLHAPREGTWQHPLSLREARKLVEELQEAIAFVDTHPTPE